MNLENSIKDVITIKLEDGTVEKLIGEELEKGVTNALNNLFRSYGDVTKIIEEKVKSVMIPYLENYNYSKYLLKLDDVLVDVLKSSSLDNKKLLENFKDLMTPEPIKEITVTELYKLWIKNVAANIDTSDLEINYDDDISYEYANVSLEVEHEDSRSWSSFNYATLIFECEEDEEMNLEIRIDKYENDKNDGWNMRLSNANNIQSLRYLGELEIFLMKLEQAGTKLILDTESESDEIEVDAVPEASFN